MNIWNSRSIFFGESIPLPLFEGVSAILATLEKITGILGPTPLRVRETGTEIEIIANIYSSFVSSICAFIGHTIERTDTNSTNSELLLQKSYIIENLFFSEKASNV